MSYFFTNKYGKVVFVKDKDSQVGNTLKDFLGGYKNYNYLGSNPREYYEKLGKEKFDYPSNPYLDRYISYGQTGIPVEDLQEIRPNLSELVTQAKEDFIVYHGKKKDESIEGAIILSTSLNRKVAESYSKTNRKGDGEVITLKIKKGAPIISTFNSEYTNKIDYKPHWHWNNQSEIVLLPDLLELKKKGKTIIVTPRKY